MSNLDVPGTPTTERPQALRLIFTYDDDSVQLVEQQPIELLLPLSDPLEGYQGHSGSWCELKDAEGRTVFRRTLHQPIQRDIEAPTDDPERSFTRRPAEETEGIFTVLIPYLEEVATVSIWDSLPQPDEPFPSAEEIAVFPIETLSGGEAPIS